MAMAHPVTRRRPVHDADTVAPSKRPASVSKEDRRVQIAAARARIQLDNRLGIATPDWIVALSKESPE